ncbi:MAG: nucleotidyltransferase [Bacteroidetes bacterium]|nr:MAG: nucleotidyltransferase [Bacteroidota bacterium]MBL1143605.1 nucleotidyltransferase [Bacteroidota bacterium]MCB0802202.1 nucleotidyltransferase [Flavobacteriales bacterium]NOG56407.1 nucleotidyltransferase [Bacteroidota bacterium]
MKIIVPMAGRGSRLRPHTLTVPKPLVPVAGKPIVQRLVEDIASVCNESIEEIGFIIGDFGAEVEKHLLEVAENLGAKGHIYYQEEALGTAHAILCAQEIMEGKTIVAFADTLFRADFKLDDSKDGIIWVQQVEDPSAFGVVKLDANGNITDFIEKPSEFVSDLAIIGIYYFKDGDYLRKNLQYLIDNDIRDKGEYQITDALERMKTAGTKFAPGQVIEWLDCGNRAATVNTNQRVLEFIKDKNNTAASAKINNSTIIQPCFIGENASIENSVVGPHVSVGANTKISNSIIKNSIIQMDSELKGLNIEGSMIGNKAKLESKAHSLSIGDYNEFQL